MKTLRLLLILMVSVPFVARAQAQGVHGKVLATSQFSLYDTIVHITSAQLKADSATPVTLVPAQGAGTIINPFAVIVSTKHTDGTAYTATGAPLLTAMLGANGIANSAQLNDNNNLINDLMATSGGIIGVLAVDGASNFPFLLTAATAGSMPVVDSIVNQPLILSTGAALSGPGTATLDVEVIYTIHKQ